MTSAPVPEAVPPVVATRMTGAAHRAELPLLVLGPSLGTSAEALWSECAAGLTDAFDVLAWDLPGHGRNHARPDEDYTMAGLAAGVLAIVDDVLAERGDPGGSFGYVGDSVGGAVGLQLALDAPKRLDGLVLLCTAARFGDPDQWADRVRQVRESGTAGLVAASAERWFGPGFVDRSPDRASALLHSLRDADDGAYGQVCRALAGFDVRDRLGEVAVPALAVAGSDDPATPPASLRLLAEEIPEARLVELAGVGHLAPAERPEEVALLVRQHLLGDVPAPGAGQDPAYDAGMAVRREVLGDAHVDRAVERTTDLTRDFQDLITRYAWGTIWTRPGLDRRSRSMITLTALIARGHHDELAMHLRAALRNGLSREEIAEVLLQSAVYCGVPDANTAFRIAQRVFDEETGA